MNHSSLFWSVPLGQRPALHLVALGTHGPNLTQQFRSERHWWLHLYGYTATLRLNGEVFPIRPGCVSLIAPGTDIEYDFRERSTHLCAHFLLPASEGDEAEVIPAMQDLGTAFPFLYQALEEAAGSFGVSPLRAEVRLWDILWRLTQPTQQQNALLSRHAYPSPVVQARQLIELRLGHPFSIKDLADEVGVSHNHLTRLFRATLGDTVIGYIQMRRIERARHLLQHTTFSVKTIAAQVGVEDVRVFYKLIRARTGCSPTQLRQKAHSAGTSLATTPDFVLVP